MNTQFIYVMDPMCSWCWAFRPTVLKLHKHYPHIGWQYLMGGLAPDSSEPMPQEMQNKIHSIWKQIERSTGTPFNYDFWENNTPRRSTYPACRAVISAESLEVGKSAEMIAAIQKAYYMDAKNPSDDDVLISIASDIGLDTATFGSTLKSPKTQAMLEQHLQQCLELGAQGFPSLFVTIDDRVVPLSYGYSSFENITERMDKLGFSEGIAV